MPPAGYTIVIGNEKGGSGKTTTSMHVIVGLLRMGFTVGSIDLDSRQQSLTHYVENRRRLVQEKRVRLGLPQHMVVKRSTLPDMAAAIAEEQEMVEEAAYVLGASNDFVVVDCPGTDTPLARVGHKMADTLITPLNDSLMDLALLADLERGTYAVKAPGVYTNMVWDQRKARLAERRAGLDWVVMRNRLTPMKDSNKRSVGTALEQLSKTVGFRIARGFGERIVYRQLILAGLTILDLKDPSFRVRMTRSHQAAREEVRDLFQALWLPGFADRLELV